MTLEDMIWEFLPKGLKGVFKVVKVERQLTSFHVWMDEIRQKSEEDIPNRQIVGKGYRDYCTIQDWLDRDTGEIFSYDIDYYDEEGTRLSAEFVSFLKGEDRV